MADGVHSRGHACSHGHQCDHHEHGPPADPSAALGSEDVWLYPFVKLDSVRALNDAEPRYVARNAIRAHDERHRTDTPYCESDADEQVLVHVPFDVTVKVKSICVIGGGSDARRWPSRLAVFRNREDLDFDNVHDTACTQQWDLAPEQGRTGSGDDGDGGDLEYPTKHAKFQNVRSLTLFFSANFGADTTRIQYVGFKGVATGYKRGTVEAVYEARPLAADSRNKIEDGVVRHVQ